MENQPNTITNPPVKDEDAEADMTKATTSKSPPSHIALQNVPWDPLNSLDWKDAKPSPMLIKRVHRDLQHLFKSPPPGIFVVPDENEVTLVHALVIGPFDTPYEGGFFYFILRVPPDYPLHPPRVRMLSTGGDTVRFNPNIYRNGKVCLSILGTWSGPSWAASLSLEGVLLSIQSLMNDKPYHNEPGFERERCAGDSAMYNRIIEHETVRVAVCMMLETDYCKCPKALKDVMTESFATFYDHYVQICDDLISKRLQGVQMSDPFNEKRGKFDPEDLKVRLGALGAKFSIVAE